LTPPVAGSHEDYAIGRYLEGAIAILESTGDRAMHESAVRAVNQTLPRGADRTKF
jgi:hypothetical protein